MLAATKENRTRLLDDFSAAVDAFDEAHDSLAPLSRRAHVLDELRDAMDEWKLSPDDDEFRERYEAAVAACDGIEGHRCSPETLRAHAGQMAALAERFANLFEAFKRAATSGVDLLPMRELFEATCGLFELAVEGFASYARRASINATEGHRDALKEALDRLIRLGSPEADTDSVLASNDAMLASDEGYYKGFEESAELAALKADGYAVALQEARDWQSMLQRASPRTTQEINRYVLRDAVGAFVGIAVYTALCLWLAGVALGVATVLFWLGAAAVALRAIQVLIIWTTGSLILLAKLGRVKPTGDEANTWPATVLRTVEFAVALFATYVIFHRLYPHEHFLWLS